MAIPAVKIESLDLDTLMALAEQKAIELADGHFTLFRFTTHWKCMLWTPNLDTGEGRKEVSDVMGFKTAKIALVDFILRA